MASNPLDEIESAARDAKERAEAEYAQLIADMRDGKDVDTSDTSRILAAAGRTTAEARDHVKAELEAAADRALIATEPEVEAKWKNVCERFERTEAERLETLKAMEEKHSMLSRDKLIIEGRRDEIREAKGREALRRSRPRLPAIPPPAAAKQPAPSKRK